MKEFFEGEVIADALKVGSPLVKADLLTWLAEKLPGGIKHQIDSIHHSVFDTSMITFMFSSCQDFEQG